MYNEYIKLGGLAIMHHLKWKYIFDPLSSNFDNNLQVHKDNKRSLKTLDHTNQEYVWYHLIWFAFVPAMKTRRDSQ